MTTHPFKISTFTASLFLILGNGLAALTLVPRVTLLPVRDLGPICIPNIIPEIDLPLEYEQCAAEIEKSRNVTNPDKDKTTEEIVNYYGYSLEVHNVTTEDGYILTVHRITGGPLSPPAEGKSSVFMHHGMGGAQTYVVFKSSDNWLFQVGDRNLAFKLVDAGYDVWLTNCRGTTYSLGHVSLNSQTDNHYWDFSWHEMAMHDVPTVMDKITEVSGNERMFYIGYSMGTTVYFIAFSEMPELNDRIIAAFMLSPVAHIGHSTNPVRLVTPTLGIGGKYLLDPIFRGRVDQPEQLKKLFNVSLGDFCTPTLMRCGICDNVDFALFGFDAPQMNYTNLPNILSKFPNIISVKTLIHYAQSMYTCQFRQFDYGPVENLIHYGNISPPAYNLTKITAPTYFFYGDMDNLAVPEDVEITRSHMLPETVVETIHIQWNLFNHWDFQVAKDADTLVYNKVLELLQSIPHQ